MKRPIAILTATFSLSALLTACGGGKAPPVQAGYITPETAKAAAITAAQVDSAAVTVTDTTLQEREGISYYSVQFSSGGEQFTYAIDAMTGTVIESTPETAVTDFDTGDGVTDFDTNDGVTDFDTTGTAAVTTGAAVTVEQAKEIALSHAGVKAADATFVKAVRDIENGRTVIDIEFVVPNGSGYTEYDYEIDVSTGAVVDCDHEIEGYTAPAASAAASGGTATAPAAPSAGTTAPSTTAPGTGTAASGSVTLERAKEIALSHAGVKAADATFVKTKQDYENRRLVYEIEFIVLSGSTYTEYDYEIDASTGAVVSYDYDAEGYTAPAASGSATVVGEAAAKKTALAKVPGATESHIVKFKTDYDDGRQRYEGTIIYNEMEYEFEIDAYSGAILEWEAESVYD